MIHRYGVTSSPSRPLSRIVRVLCLAIVVLFFSSLPLLARAHPQDPANSVPWDEAAINDEILIDIIQNRICFAMNAKDAIPNGQDAYLEIKYVFPSNGHVSLTVYNLLDQPLLGVSSPTSQDLVFQCTEEMRKVVDCQIGQLMFRNDSTHQLHAPPLATVIDLNSVTLPYAVRYNITATGLYCLVELPIASFLEMVVASADLLYVNAHGLLPAVDYPKLPFYGFTCLVYLTVLLLWMGKSALHWNVILPVQKYISVVIGFVTFETAINYFYYLDWNIHGEQSWPLLLFSAILNSIRNSASLFILLIVALGYGVVKPSLGDDMRRCQILAAAHGVLGAIYAGISLKQSEHKSSAILLIIIPLAITLTTFYVWTLSALTTTTHHLQLRRQHYKLRMYKALWRLLLFAGVNLALYFVINTVWFAERGNVAFVARWWPWRWFVVDGWLNLLYSVCMLAIAAQWRPTSENARYGLEELISDPLEDEFDLDEAGAHSPAFQGMLGNRTTTSVFDDAYDVNHVSRYASGASSPTTSSNKPRRIGGSPQPESAIVFALESDSDDENLSTVLSPRDTTTTSIRSRSSSPVRTPMTRNGSSTNDLNS